MRKILVSLCLTALSLFFWNPQADAGAIGVVIKEGRAGWGEPFFLPDDDQLRTDTIAIAKKYAPQGYNVTCNLALDRQYSANVHRRDEEKPFARAYGYDFLIILVVDPYLEPDTIHYKNRWYGNFDIYDTGAGIHMSMVDIHCSKDRHFYNLGTSYRSKQGESKKYAVYQALLKAVDGVIDYCGDRMKEDLEAEARANQPQPPEDNSFMGKWYKED